MIITMTMMTSISVYGYKKASVIILLIISVSILTVIGFTIAVYNTSTKNNNSNNYSKQCDDDAHALRVKMFDSQNVPKYIIGKDYKIIPVNPATTDVLVNRCSLTPQGIPQ